MLWVKKVFLLVFSHDYARIKIDSHNSLPLEKILNLHSVIILIKPIFKKKPKSLLL